MPTPFAKTLARLAEREFDDFHGVHETQTAMANRIKGYYQTLGFAFESVGVAWSAVFVSALVKRAGATSAEFKFAMAHSVFVFQAAKNAAQGTGVFRAFDVTEIAPKLGDIIQNNREGNRFDFAFAKAHAEYKSHSAIVVEEGSDGNGRYVRTIGGNEGDTVGEKIVRVRANGLIRQPRTEPTRFICVIQNSK